MKKNLKKAIATALLALCCLVFSGCVEQDRTFTVVETYAISAPANQRVYLEINLPVSYGYQTVSNLLVENVDSFSFTERDGYRVLFATFTGDGNAQSVRVSYTITLSGGDIQWSETPVVPSYTAPGEFEDSDSDAIKAAVLPLIEQGDPYKTAQNIHTFVRKTIRMNNSPSINQPQATASELLELQSGVCADYAILMTALLRAADIPARNITGLVYNDLKDAVDWNHPADAHAWVEFYVDGNWHFADPTWGNRYFDRPDGYHLSYGTLPGNIISVYYQAQQERVDANGYHTAGSMSAPLSFICYGESEDTLVTPRAEVQKG
jgi:hypothetical protein